MDGYLLDTNVVSELRKGSRSHAKVVSWQAGQIGNQLFISVISMMELRLGTVLAARKNPGLAAVLESWYENRVKSTFAGKVIGIDLNIAEACATLHATRPRPFRDALIAATALVHGLTVVTRNVRDFEDSGVQVLNPWIA